MRTAGLIIISLLATQSYSQNAVNWDICLKFYNLNECKTDLLQHIQNNQTDAMAWHFMGELYLKLGLKDSVKLCFDKALAMDPENPIHVAALGKYFLFIDQSVQASQYFTDAKKHAKKDIGIYLYIADAFITATKLDTTSILDNLDRAKEIKSNSPELYILYGDYYSLRKKYGLAGNDYDNAIYYDKNNIEAYMKLARIFSSGVNYAEALNNYQLVVSVDSTFSPVYKEIAEMHYTYGKYPEAVKAYETYFRYASPVEFDFERYSLIMYLNEEYTKAYTFLVTVTKKFPDNLVLSRLKSYLAFESGNFEPGLKDMELFLKKQDPAKILPLDLSYYGRLLLKNNLDSLGIIYIEKVLSLDSANLQLYDELAKSYSKLKKHKESALTYQRLINNKQDKSSSDFFRYGQEWYFEGIDMKNQSDIIYKRSCFIQADSAFSIVIQLAPESYLGYFWSARSLMQLDPETEQGLAKNDYEKAAEILAMGDIDKNKKNLIECYKYLGYYHFLNIDKQTDKVLKNAERDKSLHYWKNVINLNPDDPNAKAAIEGITK